MKRLFWLVAFICFSSVAVAQFPDQRTYVASSGGSANAQTLAVPNYQMNVGVVIRGLMSFTNTRPMTLSVNGGTVTNVFKQTATGLAALAGGEVVAGQVSQFLFDGAQFELLVNGGGSGAGNFTAPTVAYSIGPGGGPNGTSFCAAEQLAGFTFNNITSITGTSSPYTINWPSSSILPVGTVVAVSGASPSSLNGNYTTTSSSAGRITATSATTGTWSSGGAFRAFGDTCVQAAIDAAIAAKVGAVLCPSGASILALNSIYVDDPRNLRVSITAPPATIIQNLFFGNSNNLDATGQAGNCSIQPVAGVGVGVWIGAGRGMRENGISIFGPGSGTTTGYRCNQPTNTIGIAISQFGSQPLIENSYVQGEHTAFAISPNGNDLGDSNTFRKVFFSNACYGIRNFASQSYINDITDVTGGATFGISADQGQNTWVRGSNLSVTSSQTNTFTIGSFTGFTATGDGNSGTSYSFTATITSPDTYVGKVYNAYSLTTADYGVVPIQILGGPLVAMSGTASPYTLFITPWTTPLTYPVGTQLIVTGATPSSLNDTYTVTGAGGGGGGGTVTATCSVCSGTPAMNGVTGAGYALAYNPSTGVTTFETAPMWNDFYWFGINAFATTTLQTEIAAATQLYAAEMVTTFVGTNMHIDGGHIEQDAGTPTTMLNAFQSFGSFDTATIQNVRWNTDPSLAGSSPVASNNPNANARYFAQAMNPLIQIVNGNVDIFDDDFAASGPVTIDFPINATRQLFASHLTNTASFNTRVDINTFGFPTSVNDVVMGGGVWDTDYQLSSVVNSSTADRERSIGWNQMPMWGNRPNPQISPCITPAQITTVGTTLPALTPQATAYPVLFGGTQYKLCDRFLGTQTHYGAIWNHHFGSYGQNITLAAVSPAITASTSTSSPYTFTLATQDIFPVAGTFVVSGATPSSLNGTYTTTSSSAGSVTATSATTGTWVSGGNTFGNAGIRWSAIGSSPFMCVNDTTLFFQGMEVQITTSSAQTYVVTNKFPGMPCSGMGEGGLVTLSEAPSGGPIVGTSGTVYTGTSIGQETYTITNLN